MSESQQYLLEQVEEVKDWMGYFFTGQTDIKWVNKENIIDRLESIIKQFKDGDL